MPAPYDARLFLQLLGIEISEDGAEAVGRLTVTHPLIAGTGFLWAPVVITIADALCAFGVSHHWPEGATGFTTLELKSNHLATAREGTIVSRATPLHLGRTTQVWDAVVSHKETEKTLAMFRCTQLVLYRK